MVKFRRKAKENAAGHNKDSAGGGTAGPIPVGGGFMDACTRPAVRWGGEGGVIFPECLTPVLLIWVLILKFGGKLFAEVRFNGVCAITAAVMWGVILSGCNEEPPVKPPPVKNRIRVKITPEEQQMTKKPPEEWQGLFRLESNRKLFIPQLHVDPFGYTDADRNPDGGRITIRVATFSTRDDAWTGMLRLLDSDVDTFVVPIQIRKKTWYMLCHKRFKDAGRARRLAEQLKKDGKIKDFLVITLKDPS